MLTLDRIASSMGVLEDVADDMVDNDLAGGKPKAYLRNIPELGIRDGRGVLAEVSTRGLEARRRQGRWEGGCAAVENRTASLDILSGWGKVKRRGGAGGRKGRRDALRAIWQREGRERREREGRRTRHKRGWGFFKYSLTFSVTLARNLRAARKKRFGVSVKS